MSDSGLPFDDIRALCSMLPPPDGEAMEAIRRRNSDLAKPVGALGILEDMVVWLGGWQGRPTPAITRPLLAIFAANHGLTAQGISTLSQAMTAEEVALLAAGGAAANQICAVADVGLKVFELALQVPTRDISTEAAMEEKECAATIAFGMETLAGGADLLCLGAVGVGQDVVAAGLLAANLGGAPSEWLVAAGIENPRAIQCLDQAFLLHRAALGDPLEMLRRIGGREFAAACGAILAARLQRVPILLSGLVTLAAASVLAKLTPDALDHCVVAHAMPNAAHEKATTALGLRRIDNMKIGFEDGAGAALVVPGLRAAVACHAEMATRAQFGSGTLN